VPGQPARGAAIRGNLTGATLREAKLRRAEPDGARPSRANQSPTYSELALERSQGLSQRIQNRQRTVSPSRPLSDRYLQPTQSKIASVSLTPQAAT
jgi:hypothetical protein